MALYHSEKIGGGGTEYHVGDRFYIRRYPNKQYVSLYPIAGLSNNEIIWIIYLDRNVANDVTNCKLKTSYSDSITNFFLAGVTSAVWGGGEGLFSPTQLYCGTNLVYVRGSIDANNPAPRTVANGAMGIAYCNRPYSVSGDIWHLYLEFT